MKGKKGDRLSSASRKVPKAAIGDRGFDSAVGGGFPRGGLVVLAGNPGLGKTIFSSQFLLGGAGKGERGVYASFAEGRTAFLSYLRSVGYDFERLERARKIRILDFITMKEEGISNVLDAILTEVSRFKAKRLVIDSFSALAQAFGKAIDARIILHTVLSKIVRQMGCTTVLILETPIGEERIGWGVEEFVADAIIQFRREQVEDRFCRTFAVLKMRGSEVGFGKHVFTLGGGFHTFPQNNMRVPERLRPWKPIPDSAGCISTGNSDLDAILKGAVVPGCLVTMEVGTDVPFAAFSSVSAAFQANFVSQGRGMFVIPSLQATTDAVRSIVLPLVGDESFYRYCRAGEYRAVKDADLKPHQVALKGKSIVEDWETIMRTTEGLREATGREALDFVAIDTVEYTYGLGEFLKVLGRLASGIRASKNLAFILIRPGVSVIPQIRSISDVYLKLVDVEGVVMLYAVKPRTELYELEGDSDLGYPSYKLTPVL